MNLFFVAGIFSGIVYWPVFGAKPVSLRRALAKTLPVALLAFAAFAGGEAHMLTIALALSALGDWMLAFKGERYFLAGLSAFLGAHLGYCALFFAGQDAAWSGGLVFFAGTVFVFALAIGVYRRLRPHLGSMRWPVAAYCAVIAAMAVAAWARGPDPLLLAGVALFLASDIVLAFETFVLEEHAPQRRWSGQVIWYAYFAGQVLILAAFLFNPTQ